MNNKVLVIDDDLGIQGAIRAVLECHEYQVHTASNEIQALKFAKTVSPNLILLDFLLSGKYGVEIARKLRETKETSNIPIIMFSAHPEAESVSKEVSIDGFISKPFNMQELIKVVKRYISKSS